jgi:hypothetical protein
MGKTIGQMKTERGVSGPPMLHGSDVPPKDRNKPIPVVVKDMREPPKNFKSIAIIDFETPLYEKESMAVNSTNIGTLCEQVDIKDDPNEVDFDELRARVLKKKKFSLHVAFVNNPKIKKLVPSLFFALPE